MTRVKKLRSLLMPQSGKVVSELWTSVRYGQYSPFSLFLFILHTTSHFFITIFVFFSPLSLIYCLPGTVYVQAKLSWWRLRTWLTAQPPTHKAKQCNALMYYLRTQTKTCFLLYPSMIAVQVASLLVCICSRPHTPVLWRSLQFLLETLFKRLVCMRNSGQL